MLLKCLLAVWNNSYCNFLCCPPFPKRWDSRNLEYLVQLWAYCDEIYHVISWRYSAIKRRVYQTMIGYLRCGRIHYATLSELYFYTTWHYTKKPRNATLTSWSRGSTTQDRIPQGIADEAIELLTSGKHGWVHVLRQRDVTSNTYCDLATQPVLFRATDTIERKTT